MPRRETSRRRVPSEHYQAKVPMWKLLSDMFSNILVRVTLVYFPNVNTSIFEFRHIPFMFASCQRNFSTSQLSLYFLWIQHMTIVIAGSSTVSHELVSANIQPCHPGQIFMCICRRVPKRSCVRLDKHATSIYIHIYSILSVSSLAPETSLW